MRFNRFHGCNSNIFSLVFLAFFSHFFLHSPRTSAQKSYTGKTLLAVFAHPDDEGTVGPMLVKYAREGAKVYLVVATDGRFGVNEYSDYEAGDGLAAVRRNEMKCAAEKLGVELIHLNYQDQLRAAEGYDGHMPQAKALMKDIYDIVEKVQPTAIVTFGPDGWSNHMDHRLVGATVTQVFITKKWDKPMNLYYVGTPSDKIEDEESKILRGQDESYLTTQVPYTTEDLNAANESFHCHKSQFSEEVFEKMKIARENKEKIVYLRKFVGPKKKEDSVFE